MASNAGKAAPEFTAKLFSGEKYSLADNKGKVVLIHFWATWCEACQAEMPLFDKYYKDHKDQGLQIIAVSVDNAEDLAKAMAQFKSYGFSGTVAKDANYKKFGRIWRLPLTFVIDRNGVLQKDGWVLERKMTAADLDAVLGPLLAVRL